MAQWFQMSDMNPQKAARRWYYLNDEDAPRLKKLTEETDLNDAIIASALTSSGLKAVAERKYRVHWPPKFKIVEDTGEKVPAESLVKAIYLPEKVNQNTFDRLCQVVEDLREAGVNDGEIAVTIADIYWAGYSHKEPHNRFELNEPRPKYGKK